VKTSAAKNRNKISEKSRNRSWISPEFQLAIFSLATVLIFVWLFNTIYTTPYSATGIYYKYASQLINGLVPYRDFSFEYPPFALFFFALPRLLTSNYDTFALYYHYEVLVFVLIGLLVVYSIARRLGKAPWKLMIIYILGILAIGPIIAQQYDIFPAVLAVLAVYFFWLGKHKTSWVLLALGALTKIFPIILAPVFLLYYLRNRQYRYLWSGILVFVAICLVVVVPVFFYGMGAIRELISYHAQRGLQIESSYSSFFLVADKLGMISVIPVFNFGSWNLDSPLANALATLSTYFLVVLLLIAYGFIYNRMKPGKSQFSRLGAYSILVITIVLVSSKVLSPQYLIWLIPFLPLLSGKWRYPMIIVFIVVGILTYYIFPHNYLGLINLRLIVVAALFFRNLLLILLAILAVIELRHMKASD